MEPGKRALFSGQRHGSGLVDCNEGMFFFVPARARSRLAPNSVLRGRARCFLAIATLVSMAGAGEPEPKDWPAPDLLIAPASPVTFWDQTELLPLRDEGFLRRLRLVGRLHYDYVNLDTNLGDDYYAEFRRLRSGFRADLAGGFELRGEIEMDPDEAAPLYDGLTEAHLAWRPDDHWTFKAGKQTAFFTLEGSTSSNELLTVERGSLSNNLWFPLLFIPGASAAWKDGERLLFAGVFSGGSASPEFGDFDGSVFTILRAEQDFGKQTGSDEAVLGLHAVFQDPDPDNTFTRPFSQIYSLNFRGREGPWRVQSDLARGQGSGGQTDLTGLVLLSSYDLDEDWQLVARVTWIDSDGPGGIRPGRYESRITPDRGDQSEELYAGVNRYFRGHRLKWQAGASCFKLHGLATAGGDYEGWSFFSGLRISW